MRAAAAPDTAAPALPPLFRHHVRRPRLTRLLDASTSRIIVLAAPAGYGKTTLATEWLQGRPEEEVAWYYASSASADVAALSVGIAEAVSHILPAGDRVRQRLRVPQMPDDTADILAELLAADLEAWPENAWLVVDDYHHAMESKSAERFLEELIRLSPIRVLITTRRRPSWLTARRVVYGEALELTQRQLSMTKAEAGMVLAAQKPRAQYPEDMSHERWPALLGLAVLSSAAQPRRDELETTLYRYLADEVLTAAAPDEQRFMLLASIPPYLTDAVLGALRLEPTPRLSALIEQGLFTPDGVGRLRLHPLLREFLLQRVLTQEHLKAQRIASSAAEIYISEQDWDAAFQVAIDSKQADLANVVLKSAGPALLQAGRLDTLDNWLEATAVNDDLDPTRLLFRAELALRKGSCNEAIAVTRVAVHALASDDSRASAAWILLGRALHMRCDYLAALKAHNRANHTASTIEHRLQSAWGQLIATVELGRDDPAPFVADYAQLASSSPDHRLRLACGKMMAAERTGKRLPLKEHDEALALVSYASDPMAISHAYAMGIYAHTRRGAYRRAVALAEEAVHYCNSLRLVFPLAYCLVYRAQAEIGARKLRGARISLAEARTLLDSIEDSHLRIVYETVRVKLAIAAGETSTERLSCSAFFSDPGTPDWPLADLMAVESVAFAARGEAAEVKERHERLKTLRCGPTAHVSVALAEFILRVRDIDPQAYGSEAVALESVARWLFRLQCVDAFVTAYRAYPPILKLALTTPSLARMTRTTLHASGDLRLAEANSSLGPGGTSAGLTRRETEVASLIAAGLTNAEIAAELFIALSTAKVHVHRVLRKLHAKTRLEAALTWRAMQPVTQQLLAPHSSVATTAHQAKSQNAPREGT